MLWESGKEFGLRVPSNSRETGIQNDIYKRDKVYCAAKSFPLFGLKSVTAYNFG